METPAVLKLGVRSALANVNQDKAKVLNGKVLKMISALDDFRMKKRLGK